MSLDIQQLAKHYGDSPVFRNVSLSLAPGEFVAIVGESGVGKSTLLNCMAGLDSWDHGSVHLQGHNLGELNDEQRALLRAGMLGLYFRHFMCCRIWMWRKTSDCPCCCWVSTTTHACSTCWTPSV